jgi:hypothetical protein
VLINEKIIGFILFILINIIVWALKIDTLSPVREVLIPFSFIIILVSITVYANFLSKLNSKNENLLDPTFIFSLFLVLYIISPGLILLFELEDFTPIGWVKINDKEMMLHYYKMILFLISLIFFVMLGKQKIKANSENIFEHGKDRFILKILIILYLCSLIVIEYNAKPVDNYYDFYVRHDHLTGISKIVVLAAKRFYWGLCPFMLFYLALNYKENLIKYSLVVVLLCLIDLVYSHGSRINTLLIVLQAYFSIRYTKLIENKINFSKIIIGGILIGLLMIFVEEYRLMRSEINIEEKVSLILSLPGELIALYFPSLHIVELVQVNNTISISMFFEDVLKVVPFAALGEQNLMNWYWTNFHPDAIVAPYTMGVFANGALVGDFWLLTECFIISRFLLLVEKLLISKNNLSKIIGIYFVSISVLVLKYGAIAYIDQMIKNILPIIFFIYIFNKYFNPKYENSMFNK